MIKYEIIVIYFTLIRWTFSKVKALPMIHIVVYSITALETPKKRAIEQVKMGWWGFKQIIIWDLNLTWKNSITFPLNSTNPRIYNKKRKWVYQRYRQGRQTIVVCTTKKNNKIFMLLSQITQNLSWKQFSWIITNKLLLTIHLAKWRTNTLTLMW